MDKETALYGLNIEERPDLFLQAKEINNSYINTPDYWFRVRIAFTDLGGQYTKEYLRHFQSSDIWLDRFDPQKFPDFTPYELLGNMICNGKKILQDGNDTTKNRFLDYVSYFVANCEELLKKWGETEATLRAYKVQSYISEEPFYKVQPNKDTKPFDIHEALNERWEASKKKTVEKITNSLTNRGIETFQMPVMLGFAEYCVGKGIDAPKENHLGWYYGHSIFKEWKPKRNYDYSDDEEFTLQNVLEFAAWCWKHGIHEPKPGNVGFWFGYKEGTRQAVEENSSIGAKPDSKS